MHQLPSWGILTSNPSQWGAIIYSNSLNTVKVLRDIVTITGWYYNLSTVSTFLSLFITVLISYFYFIIRMGMIEEEETGQIQRI